MGDSLRQIFAYGVCGVLTTVVNYVTFVLLHGPLSLEAANALAWVASVAFAYVSNRVFVFESKTHGLSAVGREMLLFVMSRVGTGVADMAIVSVSVRLFGLGATIVKLVSNIVVIVANFALGRLVFASSPVVSGDEVREGDLRDEA